MSSKIEIMQWLLSPDKTQAAGPDDLGSLKSKISELGLEKIYTEIELPLIDILEEMHQIGIKVDVKLLEKLSKSSAKEIKTLEKNIYTQAGTKFNLNSPKQLSEILFERLQIDSKGVATTKTGSLSTDVSNLLTIKDRHSIVELILKYREVFKIYSTYIQPLRELAGESDRIHTTFVQTGTATGRLSSQSPNLQNVPSVVREVFIPEKGYALASFDYSQIELRVLASVTNDPKMIKAFQNDVDIHRLTASQVFDVDINKVTKQQRYFAKTLNFGVIYGMGPISFAKNAGLSTEEAKKFIDEYFSDFAQIKQWHEKTIEGAKKSGYVENLNGRKRWLPGITHPNKRFSSMAERAAINMPIQGLAADIIKLAMINVAKELKKKKWWMNDVRLLLSIHDELVFEIKKESLKEAIPVIERIMEDAYQLKVPLNVDSAYGKNWKELK